MRAELAWLDDPKVYQVGRLPAHSDHRIYRGEDDLAQGCTSLEQSLNGEWDFRFLRGDDIPGDLTEVFSSTDPWDRIRVPGHIELAGYQQIHYTNSDYPWEGKVFRRPAGTGADGGSGIGAFAGASDNPAGFYSRTFRWQPACADDRAVLRLDGAEQAVYVWVNGIFVGYGEDSFTPSEFDVTAMVTPGENRLDLAVFRHCTASWTEDQDFFRFFGLYRNVTLCSIPSVHLEDIHLQPKYVPETGCGSLKAMLKVRGDSEVSLALCLRDPSGHVIREAEVISAGESEVDLGDLGIVEAWDCGHPALYRLEVRLFDENGLREISESTLGFRRIEVKHGVIHVNGHRLIICGVNRHEWSADTGRAITEKEMKEDIDCLVRNHINAVRTCHYPNQDLWYHLCDEAGIYVMAETNLESHGSWQKYQVGVDRTWNVPGSFPDYREAMLDRARTNYEMLKNHPSILFWSLGNESCAGDVVRDMNRYYKSVDPERLTHYESVFYTPEYRSEISDVESRMYASPADIRNTLDNDPDKPYVLCEFMHDMGNSMGGLKDYMDLLDQYPMYHGGFIWDMIDQALWRVDPVTGRRVLGYGGDFDDRHSDLEFSGNGILFADRREKPAMQEVRELYGRYTGAVEKPEASWTQQAEEEECGELEIVFGDSCLGVKGSGLEWIFSYAFGGPESLKIGGHEWIFRAPAPAFWRATTCNDRGNGFSRRSAQWMGADLFREIIGIRVLRDGEEIPFPHGVENARYTGEEKASSLTVEYRFRTATIPAAEVTIGYEVFGHGQCRVRMHYYGVEGLPELPVLGWRLVAPTAADHFCYEGLSGETYPDRMCGGIPGIYRVEGLPVTPYLVPQECGMHMASRWVEIHRSTCLDLSAGDIPGSTLVIRMDPEPLAFSCLPYTAQELENAMHLEELPAEHRTVLTVCGKVRGVGGINSWGADVMPEYRICAEEEYEFSFIMDGK